MNPHFFQQFFGPQNNTTALQVPGYILHNNTILEIENNWEYVIDLMERHRTGKLQQVDQLEQLWYNFIITNNIDIFQYKNKEEFISVYWKNS